MTTDYQKRGKRGSPGTRKIQLEPTTRTGAEARRRVLDALALKRRHPELSLTSVAKRSGTSLKTIRSYAGDALEIRSGRLDAKKSDRLARDLVLLTRQGQITVTVRNSRDATRIARYHNALRRYLLTGDDSALQRFSGKSIRAGGKTYEFLVDHDAINRLARAGEVHFLDIYASTGGL